mgnify:CR=1 FL=1
MPDEVLLAEAAFVALVNGARFDQFAGGAGKRRQAGLVIEPGGEQQRRLFFRHAAL